MNATSKDLRVSKLDWLVLPLVGFLGALVLWQIVSQTVARDLPSPIKTWTESKEYVLKPLEKRGEMDQGILRFTWAFHMVFAGSGCQRLLAGFAGRHSGGFHAGTFQRIYQSV
jgi:nitrate/nitrite transport system permease protein